VLLYVQQVGLKIKDLEDNHIYRKDGLLTKMKSRTSIFVSVIE
jgi:hypothetical protein